MHDNAMSRHLSIDKFSTFKTAIMKDKNGRLIENKFGLTQAEYETYGDREPVGFEKIQIFSKALHHIFWLA